MTAGFNITYSTDATRLKRVLKTMFKLIFKEIEMSRWQMYFFERTVKAVLDPHFFCLTFNSTINLSAGVLATEMSLDLPR